MTARKQYFQPQCNGKVKKIIENDLQAQATKTEHTWFRKYSKGDDVYDKCNKWSVACLQAVFGTNMNNAGVLILPSNLINMGLTPQFIFHVEDSWNKEISGTLRYVHT